MLKVYSNEVIPFSNAKECDWTSGVPHLLGQVFLLLPSAAAKEAKERLVFSLHSQQGGWRELLYS